MIVAISGASGFVGKHIVRSLKDDGYEIIPLSRNDFDNIDKLYDKTKDAEIFINLAGVPILGRWSEDYKKSLYNSRIDTTKKMVEVANRSTKSKLFISTSAVGIYDNIGTYSEYDSNYGNDFLANLCKDWEKEAMNAKCRVVIFRFGIVMGSDGGAFAKMLPPFKLGLGGTIGNGRQYFSFIHISDLVRAFMFVISNENTKDVYNLTAPEPTTNLGLTKAIGKKLHRPAFLPLPEFVLKLIFGEGAKVLVDGQSAIPKRLLDEGFKFMFHNIEDTVDGLL